MLSLPGKGTLTDSNGNDLENLPAVLPSPDLTFTPNGDPGVVQFDFEACGEIDGVPPPTCDTATFVITIQDPPPLAEDQFVATAANTPIDVTLGGTAGGSTKSRTILVSGKAAFVDGAEAAGNVSDRDGNGLGDGRDDLPGPAPILSAAAVDVNLGPPAGAWALDGVTFDDDGAASGWFAFDAGSQTATDWAIDVTGGSTLDNFSYTPENSTFVRYDSGNPQDTLMFQSNDTFGEFSNSFRQLRITPVEALTEAGGSVAIDLQTANNGSGSIECINCSPFRLITAGALTAGGTPDVQGVARLQIEWQISGLVGLVGELESADVLLHTEKGTVDSLDTFFFVGTDDQDGVLTVDDFEAPVEALPGVVMPVPAEPTGTKGTFSFDVLGPLTQALSADFSAFSIQGRGRRRQPDQLPGTPAVADDSGSGGTDRHLHGHQPAGVRDALRLQRQRHRWGTNNPEQLDCHLRAEPGCDGNRQLRVQRRRRRDHRHRRGDDLHRRFLRPGRTATGLRAEPVLAATSGHSAKTSTRADTGSPVSAFFCCSEDREHFTNDSSLMLTAPPSLSTSSVMC